MSDDVKTPRAGDRTRRPYDSSARRERARASRRAVVAAAHELFETHGYAAATVAQVARAAGVSPESVYKTFGTKAALLKEVFDVAMAGDDEPVAVADRPEARRIQDEPDLGRKLRLYADQAAERAARSARIQLVIRNGAPADPALQELWDSLLEQRLHGMTMLARHLADSGMAVTVEEARDVLWTCISVEIYDLFVHQRGWTPQAWADWLHRTLTASLLPT